jgi:hypothetical protein
MYALLIKIVSNEVTYFELSITLSFVYLYHISDSKGRRHTFMKDFLQRYD